MSLSATPAIRDVAIEKLKAAITAQEEQLGLGSASDWGDYKFRTGVVNGLELAIQEIEAACKLVMS